MGAGRVRGRRGAVAWTRVPFDAVRPFLPVVEITTPSGTRYPHNGDEGVTTAARLVGRARRTATRWAKHGIPYWEADALAGALNRHPIEIWPDWPELDPVDKQSGVPQIAENPVENG